MASEKYTDRYPEQDAPGISNMQKGQVGTYITSLMKGRDLPAVAILLCLYYMST